MAGVTTSIAIATATTSYADRLVMRMTITPIIPCAIVSALSKKPGKDQVHVFRYAFASLGCALGAGILSGYNIHVENIIPFIKYS